MVTSAVNMVRLTPGLRFEPGIHGVWQHQQFVSVAEVPFRFLSYFCQHPRQLVSMETLLQVGWKNLAQRTDSDVYRVIHQLRKVIEPYPDQFRIPISERGLGYVLLLPHQTLPSYL